MTAFTEVKCPKCGTANSIRTAKSKTLVCSNCGAVIDRETQKLLQEKSQKSFTPTSDLSLGLKGKLNGEDLEIAGYILYEGKDDEDTWYWEEWFAVGKSGYFWIQYDIEEDTYTFFKQTIPQKTIDIKEIRSGKTLSLSNDERFTVGEVGLAKVEQLGGEIPWKAKIGDVINYADGSYYNNRYSIEWAEDEIEIYKGREIDRKELFAGLGMKEKLAEIIKKEQSELKWKFIRVVLWLIVLVCIVGSLFSLGSGKVIYSQQITFCPDPPTTITTPTLPTCDETDFPMGPIDLTHTNKIYKIEVGSFTASRTNWVSLDVNLLDASQQPVSGLEGDFWVEDWYEGGESGTESNYKADRLFQLTKAGQYYLDMDVDKQNLNNEIDTFNVKIYEDIILSRYFLIFGSIVLLILGLKDGWLIKMLQAD